MTPQIIAAQTKIQTLKAERLGLRLPDLRVLEQQIQHHAARAVVDDQFKPALQQLIEDKKAGELAWQRNGEINRDISLLEQEIKHAEHAEHQARLQDAERDYLNLKNEFGVAAKSLCRLHQQLKELNARNSRSVPGWQPRVPPAFDIPALNPMGWTGTTSEMLPLPWMTREKEQAA